ncbi:catalase [Duganella sp. LX20W]|uniref:Catalase n=1 Tax=Rugamonas brunnea TaxID=2758569 RepID=A0A7W2ENP1_9BURK|nr:putative metalloprotease CJM1_0395 family protein [Rugamonas brunnea]MBA5635659.1 catalase [Rugamonas brunnea]
MSTAAIPASASAPPQVRLPAAPGASGEAAAGTPANGSVRAGGNGDRAPTGSAPAAPASSASSSASTTASSSSTTLTPQALALIDRLKTRDTEVRQHEQAHLAAAGGLAVSGAAYTYQRGPNGVDYAIGGEVHIDTSPGRTPEETITRARTIQAAALAPADPSGPDRAVAAQAQQMEQQARAELAVEATQQAASADRPAPGAQVAPLQQPPSAESVRRAYETSPMAQPRLDIVA